MERLTIDEVIEHCNKTCDMTEKIAKARGHELESIESKQFWEHYQVREWLKELKSYRDAEEQGLLLRLPCKVGDTVYCLRKIIPTTYSNYVCEKWLQTDDEFIPARVVSIRTTKKGMFIKVALKGKCLVQHRWDGEYITSDDYEYCMVSLPVGCIGKTVFLTYEEAEQKLAEMKEGAV